MSGLLDLEADQGYISQGSFDNTITIKTTVFTWLPVDLPHKMLTFLLDISVFVNQFTIWKQNID